jgi:hypothetical protein
VKRFSSLGTIISVRYENNMVEDVKKKNKLYVDDKLKRSNQCKQ